MSRYQVRASSGERIFVEAVDEIDARLIARQRWARHGIFPVDVHAKIVVRMIARVA